MANASGFRRFSEGSIDVGGGVLTAKLKDGNGRFLSGFEATGKKFVAFKVAIWVSGFIM